MSRTRPSALSPIDVVEAGYQFEPDDRAWLANLAQTLYPLLDGGLGMFAYQYDVADAPASWVSSAHLIDVTAADLRNVMEMLGAYSAAETKSWHTAPSPFNSLSGGVARRIGVTDPFEIPLIQQILARMNARDVCALRTIETGGKGLVFCAVQRERRAVNPRLRSVWSKVSIHLAAARRLREHLASDAAFEAVLTPSGRIAHAEGEATSTSIRDHLRAAVQRQERARGRARREDPEGATDMWNALVSGRWSLIDHFETGGRRLIVARRNEIGSRDPRALSARERDVVQLAALGKSNKLIAYELGLAPSTVASNLSVGMRKLGVSTRVELIRLVSSMSR